MKPLLISDQICEYLGISYRRFLQYTQEDPTFPAWKVGGKWKVDPDELLDWVKNQPGCGEQNKVIQMPRRGRPINNTSRPPGGWQVVVPD